MTSNYLEIVVQTQFLWAGSRTHQHGHYPALLTVWRVTLSVII